MGGSQDDDGTWNWADGSAWDFNKWSSGNPSSWQESCMLLDKSGAWRHQDCCPVAPTVLGFICGPRKDPSHGKCHRAACTQTCNQTLITSVDAAAPWEEIEAKRGKKIRGLRCCTQQGCMIPLNRDRNGAINIGTNFMRLMTDQQLIRPMTKPRPLYHQADACMVCS